MSDEKKPVNEENISDMPTERIVIGKKNPAGDNDNQQSVQKNVPNDKAISQNVKPPVKSVKPAETPKRSFDADMSNSAKNPTVTRPQPRRAGNTEIKGYTILGKIAKGGMGEVYKGIHNGLGKEVILKKLIAKAPQTFYERFKREATIMMEVSHPNVVHLFDYFQENNSSYIVMEYVSGYNLSEIIKKFGQVPVYLACYIAYEIAKGLECAHEKAEFN